MLKYPFSKKAPQAGATQASPWSQGAIVITLLLCLLLSGAMLCAAGTPFNGTPFSVPTATIEAEQFDLGADGDAYHNPTAGQTNTYRSAAVTMENPCPDTGGTLDINNTVANEWFTYTISVPTTGWYDFQLRIANPDPGRYAHIEIDGVNVTGTVNLISNGSGNWTVYKTQTLSGYNLTAGTHVMKFFIETPIGQINLNWFKIVNHTNTTYYVSPTGSDSNNGTSASTPWLTSAKVTATAFNPGDTVLFQRGGVWREPLWPSVGGHAGLPITFGDYGSGNKPKFMGSVLLNNANFVHGTGNVYTYNIGAPVYTVLNNQQFLIDTFDGTLNYTVVRDPSNTALCWKYAGGVLTVSTAGGAPTGTWEVVNNYNVIANGNPMTYALHDHYIFNNLVSDESATDDNEGYGVRIMFGTDITVNNVESYRCGKHSFGSIDATQVIFNNCYGAYPMPNQPTGYTCYVSYGDTVDPAILSQTSEYHNCIGEHMNDTWRPGNGGYEVFTSHGATVASVWMDKMQALGVNGDGTQWDIGNGDSLGAGHAAVLKITGGLIQNNRLTISGTGEIVDGLTVTGPNGLIRVQSQNTTIQNCVVNGSELSAIPDVRAAISAESNGATVRFNTVVMGPGTHSDTACINGAGATSLYGNICWDSLTATNGVASAQYNMYQYGSTNTVGTGSVITSSPLFTNPAGGDLSLQAGSPGIDAALEPSSILSTIPVDILGNSRLSGNAFDIGAYERQSSGATPPVVTVFAPVSASTAGPFSYQIFANNFPTSYGASSLPAGLSVNTSTGLITGTPTASGSFNATITATNSSGTGSATLPFTIYTTAEYPFHASPLSVPGQIEAEDFDNGPINSAYYTPTLSNVTNAYRPNKDIDLLTTNDNGIGSYYVANSGGGMYLNYTVNVTASGSYNLVMRTACGINGRALDLLVDGVDVTGSMPVTNSGFGTWGNTTFNNISLTSGSHILKVLWNGDITDLNWFSLTSTAPQKPVITSASSASGTQGSPFSFQVTATNTPTSYGATGLPAGVTINTGNGLISGTPTVNGTFTAALSATNAAGAGNQTFTLTIGPPVPVISSAGTASGIVNTAFTYTITASNSPTSFGATPLPAGLTVNTATGVISGTPTAAGTTTVTLTATNSFGTGTKTLTITISLPAPVINSVLTKSGTQGTALSYTITATNSPTSYGATPLPAGFSVNTGTGVISGTPSAAGTTNTTISATNGGGTGSATLVFTIASAPPVITSALTAGGNVNTAFSYQITATNSPTSYNATGLPAGLTVSTSTGLISGTPTASGSSNITISATNSAGTGSATLVLSVTTGPTLTGTIAASSGTINLTATGTDDWSHWGLSGLAQNHKSGVGHISDASGLGQANTQITTFGDTFTWSDGTPTASASTTNALQNQGNGNGIGFTVPADTTLRILKVYVGEAGGGLGQLIASLSDGSVANYSDTSLAGGYAVYTITYAARSAGQTLTISWKVSNGGGQVQFAAATLALAGGGGSAPAITSALTKSGQVGVALSYTITASNSPTSYGAAPLPAGLTVNTSTGVISGTPSAAGTTNTTISATNASGTGSATLVITINPAAPAITSALTASGTVGSAFSYTITASNSPTSYGATPLSAGLAVSTSTGVISGTPTTAGTTNTTISATNAGGTGTATLVVTISAAASPPVINSSLTASGTTGSAFSYTITATNSPTSYGATPLPTGLSVNTSTGAITGTPTVQGIYSITISATNSAGTGSATLVATIGSAVTAFNINAIFTTGTAVTNGGADSFGNAYESDQLGTSATFDTKTFTFGAANALDGWSNTTVNLPPGNYTTLDMVGSAVGGNVTGKIFTVNYTDGTNSTFTIGLHDWESTSLNAGEVKVVTMADHLNVSGASVTPGAFLHGYTFTLNGKSVQSITLPATRQVIALGFAGH